MNTLLASAPSLADIQEAIRKFYCGSDKLLRTGGDNVWTLYRMSDGQPLAGVQVRKVGKRYRFEMTL